MFANCTFTDNGTFMLTYTAQATFGAFGPYPGSFTETGTVTGVLTKFLFPGGRTGTVTGWTADFTIDSPGPLAIGPQVEVTGEKVLASSAGSEVTCIRSFESTRSSEATATLAYEATIRTATGTFADRGESVASISEEPPRGDVRVFTEVFHLSTGVLPPSGKATGGGQVHLGSQPLEEVTFGFNVRKSEDGSRLDGHCNVFDHPTGTHVKCLTVTDYAQIGNSATWEGTAEVNGVEEHYARSAQRLARRDGGGC